MKGGDVGQTISRKQRNPCPKFTIITSVLNGKETIEDAICSVISQTFQDFEYIVIDGGSTDGTLSIIERYSEKIDVFISEKDKGLYYAFNKGIALASGEYIGILNSDDTYNRNALEVVRSTLEGKEVGDCVVYGGMRVLDKEPQEIFHSHENLRSAMICHPATFVKASTYKNLGNFNTKFQVAGDYDFIARCYMQGAQFIPINQSLVNYRPGGFSSTHRNVSIRETIRIQKKLNDWNQPQAVLKLIVLALKTKLRDLKSRESDG